MSIDPTSALLYEAIEAALWQDLADALTRLQEYGLDPTTGEMSTTVIDAGDAIHGGGVRQGGYRLTWGDSKWNVTRRPTSASLFPRVNGEVP